ncbi:MAG: PDDEXK nuclease domain-containing protein [Phycisphaerae bacterium]
MVGSALSDYPSLLKRVKECIRHAQSRAIMLANSEMIHLYWNVGRLLIERQASQGWGAGVLRRLAHDLLNELPEVKGFSERNLKLMTQFCREYPHLLPIGQQAVAQLPSGEHSGNPRTKPAHDKDFTIRQQAVAQLPWGHNVLLMQRIKSPAIRLWYMRETLQHGWSRNVLELMIKRETHRRQGNAITNFSDKLPADQSDLVSHALKDPYIFDFMTMTEPFHERELETQLLRHLEKFLIEVGQGFAFVGRQYHVQVGGDDFYIDLLFYHLQLRCYVVIDLKKGAFKAEYAGKVNFYLNVVDDKLRHPADNPSIGLILCQDRNRVVAEYALRGLQKPIGISEYEITRALPKDLKSSLPSIKEIEAELTQPAKLPPKRPTARKKRNPSATTGRA